MSARRLIECDGCQRPWRREAWIPADRLCTLCRNPDLEPLARLVYGSGPVCADCGLTVTEPWQQHRAEHCQPPVPPTAAYLAAQDQLRAANAEARQRQEREDEETEARRAALLRRAQEAVA